MLYGLLSAAGSAVAEADDPPAALEEVGAVMERLVRALRAS